MATAVLDPVHIQQVEFVVYDPHVPAYLDAEHTLYRIASMVIWYAVRDAVHPGLPLGCSCPVRTCSNRDMIRNCARQWLTSEDAIPYLELLELDPNVIRIWVESGCPDLGVMNKNHHAEQPPARQDEPEISRAAQILIYEWELERIGKKPAFWNVDEEALAWVLENCNTRQQPDNSPSPKEKDPSHE